MRFTDGSTKSFIGEGSGERFVKKLEEWSQQQDAARKAAQDQSSSSKDTDDHASGGFEWMKGKLHKDKDKKK